MKPPLMIYASNVPLNGTDRCHEDVWLFCFVALFEELLRVHPPPIFRRSRWWLCTAIAGFICHGMPGYWAED